MHENFVLNVIICLLDSVLHRAPLVNYFVWLVRNSDCEDVPEDEESILDHEEDLEHVIPLGVRA